MAGNRPITYQLATSTDGRSWRIALRDKQSVAEDLLPGDLEFRSDSAIEWIGDPYRIWSSADLGHSWHSQPAP